MKSTGSSDWEVVTDELEINLANIATEEGRVVSRIYDQVGNPPLCHHELPAQLLICRKEGANFMKMFWRCAHPRSYQCQYFMWTQVQPLLKHNKKEIEMVLQELGRGQKNGQPVSSGRPSRPSSSSDPPRVRPADCLHPKTTKAGSNAFMNIEKCAVCGEVLIKTMTELGRQKHIEKWGRPPPVATRSEMREWQRSGALEPRGVWAEPDQQ